NYSAFSLGVHARSEFAIVATEDNTVVYFTLSATSFSGRLLADSTYSITLDRGQVYQIMAKDTGVHVASEPPGNAAPDWTELYAPWNGGPDCDLTGSYITSNKPIAVFSGHERSTAPFTLEYQYTANPSRDHLIEQMVPISAWGKSFIVCGAGQDSSDTRFPGGDAVRVLASQNSTHISVNGTASYTLNAGEHCDFMSGGTSVVQSDQPILVAHFMQDGNWNTDGIGDPDFTLCRPVDQFAAEYTLPGVHDPEIFTQGRLLIVSDTSATSTTFLNGAHPSPTLDGRWKRIPGTNFQYGIFFPSIGEERIQSSLPCYAESYAFGFQDSYTYAGGGDYPYIDSLFAIDLDFHAVAVNARPVLPSLMYSSVVPMATDTVTVYGYEWVSGDTNAFDIVNPIAKPLLVPPLSQPQIPIRFHPDSARFYKATLRVWSSAVNSVFIHVQGSGIAPQVAVLPDTIDFGRVRLGQNRDSSYIIENVGQYQVTLTDLDFGTNLSGTDFTANTVPSSGNKLILYPLVNPVAGAVRDSVHFLPKKTGLQVGKIPIDWIDSITGLLNDTPVVILLGT